MIEDNILKQTTLTCYHVWQNTTSTISTSLHMHGHKWRFFVKECIHTYWINSSPILMKLTLGMASARAMGPPCALCGTIKGGLAKARRAHHPELDAEAAQDL